MGVPALFRWLSKKYPKIVTSVVQDDPVKIPGKDGEFEEIPVDTTGPNPNGEEFDNLYLDMNGIVHPCTHPEGKPAPKTEEEMMHEIFLYTDRVVNMVRPRKLLMMAIDGVAPRAKMNQQRSRRFRSAQEAQDKEDLRLAAIVEWEAMGKEVSDEFRNDKGWDSNAITPGTPFMDLLAKSLRYWVAKKLNEDPGWAGLQVIISDSSVPGEGEHKIMDFIRRQRSHTSHDPNTKHVIYGLDADLIMLSLATHEPHFKVLREDVFAQDKKGRGCHTCGQMGHHSSQCTGKAKEKQGEADVVAAVPTTKPFIFLDVAILREYLAVELSAPIHAFPFSLERAIDDWVFLIFFVGNDFLPHLPSLEIREGAIDVLMGIWKGSLERMGGYLAESGRVHLGRAQIILQALADREDEIFQKRREAEERQDRGEKRRKIEAENRQNGTQMQNSHDYVAVRPHTPRTPAAPHALPSSSTLSVGPSSLPAKPTWTAPPPEAPISEVAKLVAGGNSSIVANRRAIRMANLSAADMLKAELEGDTLEEPLKSNESAAEELKKEMLSESQEEEAAAAKADATMEDTTPSGKKRKVEAIATPDVDEDEDDEEEEDADVLAFLTSAVKPVETIVAGVGGARTTTVTTAPPLTVTGNMVEQEDTVKLWEPGYKERYYRQKFGIELGDAEFRQQVVKSYVEGLCWVLEYYFQGTPSWQWYYPYHFSPFASDFVEVGALDIEFTLGQPFRPYEQLMGVFPAASRIHLPTPFQSLMIDDESPIIDFYPGEFSIDMNGKKMAWQGVALLPFIDPERLLDAMGTKYPELTEDENNRNTMGADTLFVSQDHPLYDYLEGLYTKRKIKEPVPLDTKRSKGIAGAVLPDPNCIPGSTYDSPLPSLNDIFADRSISAQFTFPPQLTPHQSILLPNVKRAQTILNSYDKDTVRRGGGERSESNGFHSNRGREDRGPGFAKMDNRGRGGGADRGGGRPQYSGGGNDNYQGRGGYGGESRGGYGGDSRGGYANQGNHQSFGGPPSNNPYGGYDQRGNGGNGRGGYGGPPPQSAYGYGALQQQQRPSGGYQPPQQQGGYGAYGQQQQQQPPQGYGPPAPLYGMANLGASQGQYGYGNSGPASAQSQPPPYSGYGGYGGGGRGGQQGQGGQRRN